MTSTPTRPAANDVKALRQHAEEHARELRQRAGLSPSEPFDPRKLTDTLGIHLLSLDEIVGLSDDDRMHLLGIDAKVWSGAGLPLPNGQTLIVLHPGQTPERATATIMEEVCHAYFHHHPTRLVTLHGGIVKREFDQGIEAEAYWTGAAALLPSVVVAKAVWEHRTHELAKIYGVSTELVEFRVKTLWLWNDYIKSRTN